MSHAHIHAPVDETGYLRLEETAAGKYQLADAEILSKDTGLLVV